MIKKENKWKHTTKISLVVTTIIIVVYDIVVAFTNSEKNDTISRVVQDMSHRYWSFTIAFGALFIGHFFLNGEPVIKQPFGFLLGVFIIAALGICDYYTFLPRTNPSLLLITGAIAGRLLWPLSVIR